MNWSILVFRAKVALAIFAILSMACGLSLFGILGDRAQTAIEIASKAGADFLVRNSTVLDQLWKFIGGVASLLSGVWLIYKMWYYSDHNMPQRIKYFLDRNKLSFDSTRDYLIDRIERRGVVTQPTKPIFAVGTLGVAFQEIGFGNAEKAFVKLDLALKQLHDQEAIRRAEEGQFRRQMAGAHLLTGVLLSSRVSRADEEFRRDALAAEQHFDAALKLFPSDPQSLFYRALNSSRLGNKAAALADYQELVRSLEGQSSLLLARSYFNGAQLWMDRWRKGKARDWTRLALESLPKENTETEEAGEMHKFLGEVREVLQHVPLAIRSTSKAIQILELGPSQRSGNLAKEARRTLDRLRDLQSTSVIPITQEDDGEAISVDS